MIKNHVTILGSGGSRGVPEVGCECKVCLSHHVHNRRFRSSALVVIDNKHILIDSGPDLRMQSLINKIPKIDTVLYTHEHSDHTDGIADLKDFNRILNKPMPIYANDQTMSSIRIRFPYVFGEGSAPYWPCSCLQTNLIEDYDTFTILDNIEVQSYYQAHGNFKSLGFRINNVAYSTDVRQLPDESIDIIRDIDTWVVSCISYTSSYAHAGLDQVMKWYEVVRPKQMILTHMSHMIDYEEIIQKLPNNVRPAHDGMSFDI